MSCLHTEGPQHNCEYVDARNALMAQAELRANLWYGTKPQGYRLAGWNRMFSDTMRILWEHYLRSGGKGQKLFVYPAAADEPGVGYIHDEPQAP